MVREKATIAKIARPIISEVLLRERLFRLMDGSRTEQITWISSPAGSGKTTLIASYLDARGLPCLWYQLDQGDSDPASFFYYLGLAVKQTAPRYRTSLPLFTPEYLMGLPVFAKRYFEKVFSRLIPHASCNSKSARREVKGRKAGPSPKHHKTHFVLVFDNYQDVPPDSGFHEVIREALSVMPEGIRVIVLSRNEPPPALARFFASDTMTAIGWDDIKFTLEETKTLIGNRTKKSIKISDSLVKSLHDATNGWASGLVLMLDRAKDGEGYTRPGGQLTQEKVFDYFAEEVFGRLDSETRDFLLLASFLPRMTAHTAARATDIDQAPKILSNLSRNHFFTERHQSGAGVIYQFHPLFRNFLLNRVKESLTAEGVQHIQKRAAALLMETGQIEDAVALFLETADWESAVQLILGHAQELTMQGRGKILEQWISAIPEGIVDAVPWLLFWLGICRMPYKPVESRTLFDRAFHLFKAQMDRAGVLLCCSAAIDATIFEWNNFTVLDKWIVLLEKHFSPGDAGTSPEIEARVTVSMASALIIRQPQRSDIDSWMDRSVTQAGRIPDVNLRIQAYTFAGIYCFWTGGQDRGRIILEKIHALARTPEAAPLLKLTWLWMEGCLDIWRPASPGRVFEGRVSKAVEYADAAGLHIWDHMLYSLGAYGALLQNAGTKTRDYLEKINRLLDGSRRHVECHYHYLSAWNFLQQEQYNLALEHSETALALAHETGYMFPIILCMFEKAQVLYKQGRRRDAQSDITAAYELSVETRSNIFQFMCLLTKARIEFDDDEKSPEGLKFLRAAFRLGREKQYFNMPWWWDADAMARLCLNALEAGIELDYARKLIGIHGLVPSQPLLHIESWPWPVKIYTLGRFEIEVEGRTLSVSRSQQKPLLMLKSLVAFGGEDVPEDRLTDALWPEAEGDAGRRSFDTTLHRLRKLLGNEKMVRIQSGRLTLDPGYFWTDMQAFEQLINNAGSLWSASSEGKDEKKTIEAIRLYEKAAALYKGHFLSSDMRESWAAPARERVRAKFITAITRLSRHYQAERKYDKAIEFLQEGLAIDTLSEELYQGLMTCYQQTGRESEAAAVYLQCRKMLSDTLGVGPSTKTEEIYSSLRLSDKSP